MEHRHALVSYDEDDNVIFSHKEHIMTTLTLTECECSCCNCTEPATTTDDWGIPVCDECSRYVIDADGDLHCAREDDIEEVTECCGAGGQTRTYYRLRPPVMPESDPTGHYAVVWETSGKEYQVIARYTTLAEAEQAVEAHDWPPPADHTRYLCGYAVARWHDQENKS